MNFARVYVGCENLSMIPWQFHVVIGDQLCNIKIEIICKIDTSERVSLSLEIAILLSKVDTSASVREGMTTGSGKVGIFDWPSQDVVLLPAGFPRNYTWKWIVDQQRPSGQERATDPVRPG